MPFGSLHLQENYSRIRHPSCAFCRSFRRTSRKSCRSRRSRRNDSRPRDGGCGGAWRPLHPEMGRRQWEAAPVGFQTLIYPYMNPNMPIATGKSYGKKIEMHKPFWALTPAKARVPATATPKPQQGDASTLTSGRRTQEDKTTAM